MFPVGSSNQAAVLGVDAAPSPPAVNVHAMIARLTEQAAMDGSEEGTRLCGWCHNPYEHKARGQAAVECLHQTLFITGPEARKQPFICEGCYDNVTRSALPRHAVSVGVSNSGPPNLLLKAG